mmetsp:Transcript_10490/g.15648  ORF Transcript_10490/g.15648 Transcript_10490/m.15648 type:complete len:145 (-) Transcript_10490:141-575(-)
MKHKKRLTVEITIHNHVEVFKKNLHPCITLFCCCLPKTTIEEMIRNKIANEVVKALEKNSVESEVSFPTNGPEIRVVIRRMSRIKQVAIQQIIKYKIRTKLRKKHVKFDLKVKRRTYVPRQSILSRNDSSTVVSPTSPQSSESS